MKTLYLLFVVTMFCNLNGQTAIIGESINNNAISGTSTGGYGVVGFSYTAGGARFTGQGGIAIALGGANSQWGDGTDDCVISTDAGSTGDMILVTHDNFVIHLDDDNNSASGFAIHNGTNQIIFSLDEAGNLTNATTINGSSDINRKENITPVETGGILEKVANMPISEWQFKGEEIRHIGPMAQDFYTAFGLGQGETTIATVDADGVALAAIQALKKENDLLKEELVNLQNRLMRIETIVNKKNKSGKRSM